jgi:serine/threonine protein kinase/Tfp pilus assembly protein PilF
MSSKVLPDAEAIFHTALELDAAGRTAYITRACSGDPTLYAEVTSLIEAFEKSDGLLEQSFFNLGLEVLHHDSLQSLSGTSVGPYKILHPLGKGGMGEVYLAQDTRLDRKVALKFLSREFVGDNWAKRRLMREAQAIAMLDHPNICAVYGVEASDDHNFIVMQYIEGQTLGELIRTKGLKPDQVLVMARQIVSAIVEAHAHGIVHRDIKPRNIMVTPQEQVKVLDFGLAKTISKEKSLETADSISQLSQSGLLIGTVAYMSPEQLRGEKVDFGSDVFSLGAVLYEMAAGRNPHEHETNVEVISAILADSPPRLNTAAPFPHDFERIVRKCLEKDKRARYASAADLLSDLEILQQRAGPFRLLSQYLNVHSASALVLLILLSVFAIIAFSQLNRSLSLAVLPISNQSEDATLDYLGDGLTDDLINRLSGLSKLKVKPFTLISGYKGRNIDPITIGRNLQVDAVIVGTITINNATPNLRVTMIRVSDGSQVWTEQYPIEKHDVLPIEDDVPKKIISKLELWSTGDERRVASMHKPESPEAHRLYMQGRYYLRNRDRPEDIEKAITSFNQAIKIEPTYAKPYAGLADCYVQQGKLPYGRFPLKELVPRAEAAANEALEYDSSLAEAHTALGTVNMNYKWNWQMAEKEFKSALAINPNYAPAHYGYSNLLVITKQIQKAISESETARDLDPFSPPSTMNVCRSLYYARQYTLAESCLEKLKKEFPDNTNARYVLAWVYLQEARYKEAITIFEEIHQTNNALASAGLGYAYGLAGRRTDALKVLAEMNEMSKLIPLSGQEFAIVYIGIGEKDQAIALLNKSADESYAALAYLDVEPVFDSLRSDSRFSALLRRLNLPSAHPAGS